MSPHAATATILTNKLLIQPEFTQEFAEWQADFNHAIADQPGFVSLEILSPIPPQQPEWLLIQRFNIPEEINHWLQSERRQRLFKALNRFLVNPATGNVQETSNANHLKGGVTEVFVTQINPKSEPAYRAWAAKIHQAEAKFPGFRGVYMQSPNQTGGQNWVTMLQFDTPENLDGWLNSSERKKVLEEGQSLISSLESHRVISPYAGWFSSMAKGGELPPAWKQTMIVLLVLFPIVMLEMRFLNIWTKNLNPSLSTFIGNALSVTLIAWPMTPIAVWFLGWWLAPKASQATSILGTFVVILLYICEIAAFWKLL